nr:hypothetical protein [Tanacetum cinerariifolium]
MTKKCLVVAWLNMGTGTVKIVVNMRMLIMKKSIVRKDGSLDKSDRAGYVGRQDTNEADYSDEESSNGDFVKKRALSFALVGFIRNVGASRANSGSRDGLKATLSLKSGFPGVRCVDFSIIDDVIAIWDKAMCLWTKAGQS